MSETQLKPCPFCGGEAFVYLSGSISNGICTEVTCRKCGSKTERLREDLAIKAWNRRTTTKENMLDIVIANTEQESD